MQRFYETVFDTLTGAAISGAEVWLWRASDNGLAAIFSTSNGLTVLANPMVSDGNGFVECYVADGLYNVEFKFQGISLRTINDVAIFDLADMRADLNDVQTRMTTAEGNITTLNTNLTAEIANRIAAVSGEATARAAAVAGEATTRANADTALNTAIGLKLDASAVSAYGLTLVAAADAITARGTLGLGTMATATAASYYTSAQADAAIAAAATPEATNAEIWTGTNTAKLISARRLYTSGAEVALVDGATITPDFNTGINFGVTLAGNRTLANPTNAKSGQSGLVFVTQDATGNRTLVYGTNWKFPGGAPTLSTAANAVDMLSYFVRANGIIAASIGKALA